MLGQPLVVIELNESSPVSLAHVLAIVDLCIKVGGLLIIYGHSIVPSTSVANLEWLTTKWWPLVKHLKHRADQGLIEPTTITKAYESLLQGDE